MIWQVREYMKKNPDFEFNMFMFIMVYVMLIFFRCAVEESHGYSYEVQLMFSGILYLWICHQFWIRRVSIRAFIGPLKFRVGKTPGYLLIDILFTIAALMAGAYVISFFNPSGVVEYLNERRELTFFNAVLVAPVVEEVFCRGILINMGGKKVGRALILSTVFFAMMHGAVGPIQLFGGYILGYLYIKSGSLLLSIFYHMAYNGVVILIDVMGPVSDGLLTLEEIRGVGLYEVIFFLALMPVMIYIVRKTWRDLKGIEKAPYEKNFEREVYQGKDRNLENKTIYYK